MRELVIPAKAHGEPDAVEFIRFWIAGGSEHVALNVDLMGDREVEQWGMMLADLSIHIVRALKADGAKDTDDKLRSRMDRAYRERLKYQYRVQHTGGLADYGNGDDA